MARVLVVGATHGNERNAGWLVEGWRRQPHTLRRQGLAVPPD
jgi:aspartoacylase